MAVLLLVEHDDGEIDELSLQAFGLARGLGDPVHAVLVGGAEAATRLGAYGVTNVHVAEDERLSAYAPGAWASALGEAVERVQPSAVVAPGSERGNEVMAHLAARRDLPFAANCIAVGAPDGTGESLDVTRVRWGGTLLEEARIHSPLPLLTAAPHAVAVPAADDAGAPAIEPFAPALAEGDLLVQVAEHVDEVAGGVSLAEAKVVVSGGRGVGSADGFGILEELAGVLDAAVGCSRVVTSAGWRPHTDQVGQTGTKVSPDLYIACGISGATQHIAGCKGAKKILAINSDAEAPILASADYAVIGDLTEIVPAITAELRKARSA
jgi:electron transfer flavoprotein alpha subunit